MEADGDRLTTLDVRLEEFEQILSQNPDDLSTLSAYGEAALLRGRLLEAMKSYQRLTALKPDSLEFQLALGKVYLDSGLYTEAYGVVRHVLERAPQDIEGHILLRRLAKANGSVSEDISGPLGESQDYLPDVDMLAAERTKLESELAQLDGEIVEHTKAVESSPGEPAPEFSMLMARLRRTRMEESLSEVTQWESRHKDLELEKQAHDEAAARQREEEERARQEEDRKRQEEEERARREEELRQQEEEAARLAAEAAASRTGGKEREEAHAKLAGALSEVAAVLLKAKGVAAVLVIASDGVLVHETHSQEVDVDTFSTFVVDALAALNDPDANLGPWQSWVIEFAKGILVLRRITDDYYVVVFGQAGANFGILTFTLEKNKAQLEGALANAPAVPTNAPAS